MTGIHQRCHLGRETYSRNLSGSRQVRLLPLHQAAHHSHPHTGQKMDPSREGIHGRLQHPRCRSNTHHYESYNCEEDFYEQANFSVSLILGTIDLCMILDIEGANNLLEALSVSLGKGQSNVSSVAKDPTDFYVVHSLTEDDREAIRNFLCGKKLKTDEEDYEPGNLTVNGRPASEQEKLDFKARMKEFKSNMDEFTRKNEARELIEKIIEQRRNELGQYSISRHHL